MIDARPSWALRVAALNLLLVSFVKVEPGLFSSP